VVAEHGVDLARVGAGASRREGLIAYLELHIEQGPVLEREGIPVAAVSGTVGVERHRFTFEGQASHAGTTPMELRRDAGLAAAATALAVEEVALRHSGVGTTGVLRLEPGIPTAVAGRAELVADLRHAHAAPLAGMLAETRAAAREAAAVHDCSATATEVWHIEPIPFDARLVAAALEAAGTGRTIVSGALHDAAEMARHLPVAMMFTSSTAGLSHAKEEDTPEADLERAIGAFVRLALGVAAYPGISPSPENSSAASSKERSDGGMITSDVSMSSSSTAVPLARTSSIICPKTSRKVSSLPATIASTAALSSSLSFSARPSSTSY
jgi:hydantoinase/carbamoylase family amidase